jgi:hypothetical protein
MWYQTMGFLQDPEVQRKGLVLVLYSVGIPPSASLDLEFMRKTNALARTIPVRFVVHFFYDDYRLTPLISLLQLGIGKNTRLRIRTHFGKWTSGDLGVLANSIVYGQTISFFPFRTRAIPHIGSHQECQYTLMTFGIQANMIPMDPNGHLKLDDFTNYIKDRKRQEAEAEALSLVHTTIPYPSRFDILLGRGKPYQEYIGNTWLNTFVSTYYERFQQAGSHYGRKNAIAKDIIQMIGRSGGRFLKRSEDENGWEVATDQVILEKVSHLFRTRKYRESSK